MSNELHIQLRAALVALYPTVLALRRVTFDAAISVERVDLTSNMLACWDQVLQEAAKSQKVAALLAIVQGEYPHYGALAEVQIRLAGELPEADLHLLNFGREFTAQQRTQLEIQLCERIHRVLSLPARFDDTKPYAPQCEKLIDQIGWTRAMWESMPVIVNPPGFVPGALCLLAELHGRMGHFPTVVRLRPVEQQGKVTYVVAEVMNLQMVRHRALARGK